MTEHARTGLEVAIIGMSGAFPGAKNVDEFLDHLQNGVEGIRFFTDSELEESGIPPEKYSSSRFVRAKGYLEQSDYFDHSFFGYTPNEALYMDPQTRLLHEHTWRALEDAGYPPERTPDAIGVYAGGRPHFHWEALSIAAGSSNGAEEFELAHLNDKDLMSTRVSYKLNLKGPSFTMFTACSTSLVAVHLACQAVLSGECYMAVAGGVSVTSPLKNGYVYQEGMIMSPDGHCRSFDASSGGTVVGNGIGLVILKRLEEAMDAGDHIYAVIKGSAINNDGNRKVGFTAPSVDGQAEVIRAAHRVAGVAPASISYIEAHGTGTALGDPIEVKALTQAFRTSRRTYCGLGSVKSSIGHLDSAAGISGLIKTVLGLKHKKLFPTLHFSEANPNIDFAHSPFYIVDRLQNWEPGGEFPLRAGVSSFGVGGTNAHVILEEAPPQPVKPEPDGSQLLVFSAKTPEALAEGKARILEYLQSHPETSLADLAYTLQHGREHFPYRCYAVCSDKREASALLESGEMPGSCLDRKQTVPPVTFVFAGDSNSGHSVANYRLFIESVLYAEEFDNVLKQLAASSEGSHAGPLPEKASDEYGSMLTFCYELAFAKYLVKLGIKPAAVAGTGSGLYTAACFAGVTTLEDSWRLLQERNSFIEEIAGNEGDILLLEAIQSDHYETLGTMDLRMPAIPVIDPANGHNISERMASPDYWVNQINGENQNPPNVLSQLSEIAADQTLILFDINADSAESDLNDFITLTAQNLSPSGEPGVLDQLGHLWLQGYDIRWSELNGATERRRIPLPGYSFNRKQFKIQPPPAMQFPGLFAPSEEKAPAKAALEDWLYVPTWTRSVAGSGSEETTESLFVVFASKERMVSRFVERLARKGQQVVWVEAGDEFSRKDKTELPEIHASFTLNPDRQDDFDLLFEEIAPLTADKPLKIVHFWCLGESPGHSIKETQQDAGVKLQGAEAVIVSHNNVQKWNRLGYYTLLHMVKAIGKQTRIKSKSIDIIADRLWEVTGNETVVPAKATLLGPLRVIPKEYEIQTRLFDVDLNDGEALAERVQAAMSADNDGNDLIAVRNRYLWQNVYQPIQPSGKSGKSAGISDRLKQKGVYVITGGTGGIGLHIARYLAQEYGAVLVLLNRSVFLPEAEWDRWSDIHEGKDPVSARISQLRQIRNAGGQLLMLQADAADEQQVYRALEQTIQRYGRIDGIFHTAGVADGSVIQRRSTEMSESVFAPKIYGTLGLQHAIEQLEIPIDFLMLFSSLSTVIAPPAQVAYCAANAYLDAAVQKEQRYFTQVVNWDMWADTGMSSRDLLPLSPTRYSSSGISYTKLDHPLLQYVVEQKTGTATFISTLLPYRDWVLNEHRVAAAAILPGTSYIEIVSAAYRQCVRGEGGIVVQDLVLITPLVLTGETGIIIRTTLTGEGARRSFAVESRPQPSGGWVLHAEGRLDTLNSDSNRSKPAEYDLEQLTRECGNDVYDHSHYNQQRSSGFQYGARWGGYIRGTFGGDSGLSKIELPSAFRSDLKQYSYHPALMDVALVYMDPSVTGNEAYAPFSYKKITIYGPVPGTVYSYIRYRGGQSYGKHGKLIEFDLTIMDVQGNAIVEIEGYRMAAAIEPLHTGVENPQIAVQSHLDSDKGNEERLLRSEQSLPAESMTITTTVQQEAGLTPEEGMVILNRILSCSHPRVLVSTTDLTSRLAADRRSGIAEEAFSGTGAEQDSEAERDIINHSREEIAESLMEIWKRVLGHDTISERDDFFELGGDSLKVLTVAESVHQQLNVKIPVTVFFNSPTIGELSQFIKSEYTETPDYSGIAKTARQDSYPLSSAQKRLYFQHLLAPGNMAYHIPEISLLEGRLDIGRLQAAFEELIDRHPLLRTGFHMVDGEPVQTVCSEVDFHLEFTVIAKEEIEQTAAGFMQPFDLSKAPLMRVAIAQYEHEQYLWLLDIHHIIADNLSVTMLQNEMFDIYNGIAVSPRSEGPDYFDYIQWHNSLLESGDFETQLEYWLKQCADKLSPLALPTDYARPDIPSYRGDTYTFEWDEDIAVDLKQAMKTGTTTLFMNMMALYSVLLHKYTGQKELMIGASLSGRNHADLQQMMGMFANVLPFRAEVQPELSYMELLERVKAGSLELFEHQDVPFDVLVDHLGMERSLSANPLFNVMLVLPDYKPGELIMDGVKVRAYPFRNKTSKLDLTLWVYDLGSTIQLKWEYAADLFTRETILGIAGHLTEIARQVNRNPQIRMKDIMLETAFIAASPATLLNDGEDFAF